MKISLSFSGLLFLCCLLHPRNAAAQDTTTVPATATAGDSVTPAQQSFIRKMITRYRNDTIRYNKSGFVVKPSSTFGAGYAIRKSATGRAPFTREHSLMAYYTIGRGALFLEYRSNFFELIGKWNVGLVGRVDLINVVNFFGVGNETVRRDSLRNRYYRLRSNELSGSLSINRLIDSTHFIEFRPFYQTVDIRADEDKFVMDPASGITKGDIDDRKHFGGVAGSYHYQNVDNSVNPTKGIAFGASAAFTANLQQTSREFARYASALSVYLPLFRTLTLAVRAGGATAQGNPEFFQLNTLGGSENLRGFRRQRFYGKTSFYNNNELRWLVNAHNSWFDGKIGLLAFVDQGRVWHPGEVSDTWHVGYGGGLLIVPFNRIVLNGTYGVSKTDQLLHVRIGFLF